MRRLLRFLFFAALLAGVAAVAARVRERLAAPVPLGSAGAETTAGAAALEEPPPAPAPTPATPLAPADDLAEVWGIGPVFRGRLATVGITTFAALAASDPAVVAAAAGVPEERAAGWIAEAAARAAG
jgi:predicted flap endonuclease-1-like 5' DNA nuclease